MSEQNIDPQRIVLILPCCIGDVIMATATLKALRRAYPKAHITWAISTWARPAIEQHDLLDAVLDTGPAALPVKSPLGFRRFVRQLRDGNFDLAVSLLRSPLMSLAVRLSGIPQRAGLDSAGRGFGYTVRARIDPKDVRPEAEIYLDVARALGIDTSGCYANVPVEGRLWPAVDVQLRNGGINGSNFIVIHPAGGRNPGMTMDSKRWPSDHFAALANRLAARWNSDIVLLGSEADLPIMQAVQDGLDQPAMLLAGALSFPEIGLLAQRARLYIGNDTGLTHLAAASGARTVMILGPSDPKRYAPYVPNALALWKTAEVAQAGVSAGTARHWDWARDGISVDEAEAQILEYAKDTK